jgi:iron complex outermembrane receptor protein
VEQSVGLFVDGVYEPRAREFTNALFDIDHLEVIKGSQGVLFGKNTSIGAISVLSKLPGPRFGGYLLGSYEAAFGSWDLEGAVDLPVSDSARIRVAGLYNDEAGYVENVPLDRKEPEEKRWVVRGIFDWDPTPNVNVMLKLQGSNEVTVGNAFQFVNPPNPAALPNFGGKTIAQLGVLGTGNYTKYTGGLGIEGDAQHSFDPALIIKAALGGGYTLTSTTGYSNYEYHYGFDSDSTPQPIIFNYFHEKFSQVSQEIRLASPAGQRVDFIAGVFALHNTDLFDYDLAFQNYFVAPGFGISGLVNQKFTQTDNDYAAFAQASWHIVPRLTLDVGGRLSYESKTGTYIKTVPGGFTFNLAQPATDHGVIAATTFDASGTLSYKMTDSSVAYASIGQGSKAGAFNNTSLLTALLPSPFTVPTEVSTTYEIGVKGAFFDSRVYASLSAFMVDVSHFQDAAFSPAAQGFIIRSIGAHTRGLEAEGQWQATPWLQFYGNFAYTPVAQLADGERMQRAPEFTGVIGARGSMHLTDDWSLEGNVQLTDSSSYWNQPSTEPGQNQSGSYAMVDARIALVEARDHLTLSIDGANLNNAVYRTFTFGAPLGGTVGMLNRPRTITFTVRKGF